MPIKTSALKLQIQTKVLARLQQKYWYHWVH